MHRREFIATTGGTLAAMSNNALSAAAQKTRFYLLTRYFLKNGTQPGRIHEFLEQHFIPKLAKVASAPLLCLEALVAPHMPQVAVLAGFRTMDDLIKAKTMAASDDELAQGIARWEAGDEAPYETYSETVLEATNYAPELATPAPLPKTPRLFELRVYHSPTHRQLAALHERFAGPEIKIFHRVGVHPILYASTLFGPDMPNLTYMTPFADLAAREKAWNAFGADPEWAKVRKESIERHGQISAVIQILLFRATKYSPMQ